jgi:hypothetical protein
MATLDVEPQPLGQAIVGTAPVLVYTVPAVSPDSGATVKSATIRDIKGANLTASARRIRLWIGPPIGSPDDTRVIFPDLIVPENGVAFDDGVNVVNAGGQIWGSGDTSSAFNITVSGALTVVA